MNESINVQTNMDCVMYGQQTGRLEFVLPSDSNVR